MNRSPFLTALVLGAALVTACSQQKPAEQAVAAAEQALADVHELSLKYVPDQYQELKTELDAARRLLQEAKFGDALATAKGLPGKAQALGEQANAARDQLQAELQAEWPPYAEKLPGQLSALETRINELAAAKTLPEGIDERDLRAAKDALPYATKAWAEALASFEQGDLEGAVARARAVEMLTDTGLSALDSPPAG